MASGTYRFMRTVDGPTAPHPFDDAKGQSLPSMNLGSAKIADLFALPNSLNDTRHAIGGLARNLDCS